MNLQNSALAALSGALFAAAFPTFNLHFLAWFAFIPFFLVLKGKTVKEGFWLGGIMGTAFFIGTVYWVTNSVHFYGHMPLVLASLVTLLLCVYLAIYTALFGAAAVHVRKHHPTLFIIAAPALWVSLELARTYVFSGFPWSLAGYSQYSVLPVIQIADITGVYGVSFLIILINTAIAEFLLDRKNYRALLAVAVAMIAVLGYGWVKLEKPEKPGGIIVSVVQGNIEQDKKWDPTYQAQTIAVYKKLTLAALKQRPDLVLWPETAVPFYFTGARESDLELSMDLIAFVKQNKTPLLFGSPTFEVKPDRRIIGRNSAFLLTAEGAIGATYHKIHLVPFGEYVPLKSMLFFVEKMVEAIGDFQAGDAYTVMTVPYGDPSQNAKASISTLICYEMIFPDLVRQFVNHGATIITTVTNDAWFGKTAAPYQHFSMAVFRAVENRVPIARAANTGISGFVDDKGKILETSKIFTEAQLTRTIQPGTDKTFYTRHGDWFSYACLVLSILLVVFVPKKIVRVQR
jgi:apolipoprotein N-acyltransferase